MIGHKDTPYCTCPKCNPPPLTCPGCGGETWEGDEQECAVCECVGCCACVIEARPHKGESSILICRDCYDGEEIVSDAEREKIFRGKLPRDTITWM